MTLDASGTLDCVLFMLHWSGGKDNYTVLSRILAGCRVLSLLSPARA
jgi:hypothetical protein